MKFEELACKAGETAARVGGRAHRPALGEALTARRRRSLATWSTATIVLLAGVVLGGVLTWPTPGSQAPAVASESTTTTVPPTSITTTSSSTSTTNQDNTAALPLAEVPETCPVTLPGENAFTPRSETPEPLPALYESVWYGTPELWTTISPNGEEGNKRWLGGEKTFWWSKNFNELEPDISVTAEHLDESAPSVEAGAPGTNGSHPDLGDFMLVGVELSEPGCWKLTAEYKGTSLSYVMWVPEE